MTLQISIRNEREDDIPAIRSITTSAFSGRAEADLIDALRSDGDLVVSLVATSDDAIIGHVGLSRLVSPERALALAPLSVAPAAQRRSVGSALMNAAVQRGRDLGYAIIFVLGDPAYYTRFGFSLAEALPYASPYAGPHFMALRLDREAGPSRAVIYAPAFAGLE